MAAGDPDELAEAAAEQLIARWGVLFRDLARRENLTIAWRDLLWACRRLEARGTIRGGRFVSGFSGGVYLTWNVTGHVHIIATASAPPNAVISGIFFGPGATGGGVPSRGSVK